MFKAGVLAAPKLGSAEHTPAYRPPLSRGDFVGQRTKWSVNVIYRPLLPRGDFAACWPKSPLERGGAPAPGCVGCSAASVKRSGWRRLTCRRLMPRSAGRVAAVARASRRWNRKSGLMGKMPMPRCWPAERPTGQRPGGHEARPTVGSAGASPSRTEEARDLTGAGWKIGIDGAEADWTLNPFSPEPPCFLHVD